ncbi:MAG: S41 family peptidase [Planctomycetales bacterium]|nr:S41 family peptidase [Planctomycetales bacterium]
MGVYLTKRQFLGMFVATPILTLGAMLGLHFTVLAPSYALPRMPGDDDDRLLHEGRLWHEVRQLILSRYVDAVEPDRVLYGALSGMVDSLDDHSQFLPPEVYREEKIDTQGHFGGLGIEVGVREGWLTVITPLDDSPALAAGILAGDRIVAIEGEPAEGMGIPWAAARLRGSPGTAITLTVVHEGEREAVDVRVERAEVRIRSVRGARILDADRGIGYVRVASFVEKTAEDFDAAVRELREKGLKALVLDLRWNPGGLLTQGVALADRFLEDGTIVETRTRAPGSEGLAREVYSAKSSDTLLRDEPVVLLVNHGTASAAEIVAGALQDRGRGTLLGTRTYGKGTVQTIFEIEGGKSGLRLTTGRYYTPKGRQIQSAPGALGGLVPDLEMKLARDQHRALQLWLTHESRVHRATAPPPAPPDPQIERAVALLAEKLAAK